MAHVPDDSTGHRPRVIEKPAFGVVYTRKPRMITTQNTYDDVPLHYRLHQLTPIA